MSGLRFLGLVVTWVARNAGGYPLGLREVNLSVWNAHSHPYDCRIVAPDACNKTHGRSFTPANT